MWVRAQLRAPVVQEMCHHLTLWLEASAAEPRNSIWGSRQIGLFCCTERHVRAVCHAHQNTGLEHKPQGSKCDLRSKDLLVPFSKYFWCSVLSAWLFTGGFIFDMSQAQILLSHHNGTEWIYSSCCLRWELNGVRIEKQAVRWQIVFHLRF